MAAVPYLSPGSDKDLMARMRYKLESLAYSSRLYRMMISGPVPRELACLPGDPWPGDAKAGQECVEGSLLYAGQRFSAHPPQWLPEKASLGWLLDVHSLHWLRDLRALGGDNARRMARSLLSSWLDAFEHWSPFVWNTPLVAQRISCLITLHDFMLASADNVFRARVFESLVRHYRHLLRLVPGALAGLAENIPDEESNIRLPRAETLQGIDILVVLRGLIHGGVALPDGTKALTLALSLLPNALRSVLLADGMVAERSGMVQARALRCLIDIRQALKAAGQTVPPELPVAIEKAAGAMRFLRHGDGSFALFNGAREVDSMFIEALLAQADVRGRMAKSLPHGGFERLTAGRMLVLADVSVPPPEGLDRAAHAGLGSFECSFGRERLVVNCGAHAGLDDPAWRQALAATAAHSTLCVANTNSSEILSLGGIGRKPHSTRVAHTQEDGAPLLEIGHDGYFTPHRLMYVRRLMLRENGDELHGEDILRGSGGHAFAIRFHLHPLVQASLIQNSMAVLLRLPGGTGFRFRAEGQPLVLEESIYCGRIPARPSQQIVVKGISAEGETKILWHFTREGGAEPPAKRGKKA